MFSLFAGICAFLWRASRLSLMKFLMGRETLPVDQSWTKEGQAKSTGHLRIGILGAARIAPPALIYPSRKLADIAVVAVAARDVKRAQGFAKTYDIPKVYGSYEELLDDPDIDAIYNPLPNALHLKWTKLALEKGKHVLCEKPLTANAAEAAQLVEIASRCNKVLFEAFHWQYHPLALRAKELLTQGAIGSLKMVKVVMGFSVPNDDIRFDLALAGGATMDGGCYAINVVRFLTGMEPVVESAQPEVLRPGVDSRMDFTMALDGGATAHATVNLKIAIPTFTIQVQGTGGELSVYNYMFPHVWHRLWWRTSDEPQWRAESFYGERGSNSTYEYQLQAFVHQTRLGGGQKFSTNGDEAVKNMAVIDAVYAKAGMDVRTSSLVG